MSSSKGPAALAALCALLCVQLGADNARAETTRLPIYTATYQAFYKGHKVGSTQFEVSYDTASDTYSFTNTTQAKGILRLARPKPAVDRSKFRYANGRIVPLEFWYEDGSRKGEDNIHTVFEWDKARAVVTTDGGSHEMPLPSGTLDRASVQVALMLDLKAGAQPGPYRLADDDSIDTYNYSAQGSEKVSTPYGDVEATRVEQKSEGSSRTTYIWAAPSLQFLPVKIEQRRNGEVLSAFVLEAVKGLGAAK